MSAHRKHAKTVRLVLGATALAALAIVAPVAPAIAQPTVPTVPTVPPKKPAKKPARKPTPPPAPAPAPAATDTATDTKPADAPAPAPAAPPPSTSGAAGSTSAPAEDAAAKAADAAPAKTDATDVDALRQEYLSLRDELFKSRARANAVASQLYSTRVQIKLTYTTARFYNPAKSSIRLDGASVYEDASGAIGGDDGIRFDGYIAPGRHLITFRVEATGKDDDTFSSTTESQIVVKATAGKDLIVAAKAHDSGDIAFNWKKTETGSYGLGIDVAIATGKVVEAAGAKK
jgi:hypothetical protein